jgi:AcrR family transcriptional regulator
MEEEKIEEIDWKSQFLGSLAETLTEKHRRILISAVEVFSEKGYSGATTKEIALRAQATEAAIFKYYKGKEDLFKKVASLIETNILARFLDFGLDAIAQRHFKSAKSLLYAILENRVELIQKNIVPVRVMIQEVPFHQELKTHVLSMLQNTSLIKNLRKALKDNFGVKKNANEILSFLVNCIFGFLFMRCVFFPELFTNSHKEIAAFAKFLAKKLEA